MSEYTKTSSAPRGQKLVEAYGRDDSSMDVGDKQSMQGKKMGGGVNNLGHSLTGASAVQHAKGE